MMVMMMMMTMMIMTMTIMTINVFHYPSRPLVANTRLP